MSVLFEKLRGGELLVYRETPCIISLEGSDAVSFLQRMSTNDLSQLSQAHPIQTSFTNNKGRMIDHCLLFAFHKHHVLLVSSHHDPSIIMNWLEQYHFIEDVIIKNMSCSYSFWYLIASCQQNSQVDLGSLSSLCWSNVLSDVEINFYGVLDRQPPGQLITKDIWQTLRIMAQKPESPSEINDSVMPQNINLALFISDQKGCYIGQEVIAKARTYQKNVKTLCGAKLSKENFSTIKPGSLVHDPEGQTGEITSVAPIYIPDTINALLLSDLKSKPFPHALGNQIVCREPFITKKS